MVNKKPKKDKEKERKAVRTSPRKTKVSRDAEGDLDLRELTQEDREQSEKEDEAAPPEGDGERSEKAAHVWTPEEDEQIASFFEENSLFYDMTNSEYKNKKKRENLLLELARTMFHSGKFHFISVWSSSVFPILILYRMSGAITKPITYNAFQSSLVQNDQTDLH